MGKTELTPRKKAVLSAIIKAHIDTGEPIGSKILMSLMENAPSSATLRNEMNELCNLGLLAQPHTSAGRVPTGTAYKLYVNSLMQPVAVGDAAKSYIDSRLGITGASQNIPGAVAEHISELTGYPAIYSYMVDEDVYIRQIELLPVGRRSAVLLAVISDGRTVSRVCHFRETLSLEQRENFLRIIREKLRRKPLCSFNPAFLQNTVMSDGCLFELMPLITELFDMVYTAAESTVKVRGQVRLYNFCDEARAQKIVGLVEKNSAFQDTLKECGENTVLFGADTPFKELSNKAVISAQYTCMGRVCGRIGIIAPERISYEHIIPSIEYTAERLSALMTDAANDMED